MLAAMARTAHEQRIWLSPICSRGCRAPGLSRRPLLPSGAQTCTSRIKMLGFKPLRRVNDRPQLYGKQKDHRHAPLPCYSPTAAPHFGAPFSGALADARPLRPPPHQHTRSPVRARRRMAARMQLLAPLFLRRVHRNTPPRSAFCVDSSHFLSSAGVLFRAVARQLPRNSLVGRRHAARAERPTPGREPRGGDLAWISLSPVHISGGWHARARGEIVLLLRGAVEALGRARLSRTQK